MPVNNNDIMLVSPTHVDALGAQIAKADEFDAAVWGEDNPRYYTQPLKDGGLIAIVPVHGYLAHRMDYHYNGWFTGYEFIREAITDALENPQVKGIVLDVNSGGGMVAGAFETAEFIADAAKIKPLISIVDASAYSAAYLIASQTNEIYVSKSGGVGSIGVVTMHVDRSEELEERGIKVELLYKGAAKVDGNPFEKLSDGARSRIMGRLEVSYNLFVDAVASGRDIDPDAVRGTEAALFQGEQAKTVQLVDVVMNPSDAYNTFAQQLSQVDNGGLKMTTEATTSAENDNPVDTKMVAQEAKVAERQRIQQIVGSDAAQGRSDLASYLAYETEMSVEDAVTMLGKAPVEAATNEQDHGQSFNEAMQHGNPEIKDEAATQDEGDEANQSNAILQSLQAATGVKLN